MGWTHYWQREIELPAKPFEDAVNDCRKLFESLNAPLAGAQGKNNPMFTDEKIAFNGAAGYGCEPFIVNRIQPLRPGRTVVRGYCKTERLLYDLYVQCALIILNHYLNDMIKVTSDGTDYDWDKARKTCVKYLGYGSDFCLGQVSDS
jgi:hypothetical protein